MTSISPRIYADLVGKPFLEGGRGPGGYDCVGLAVEFQTRRGIAQPQYLSNDAELHRQVAAGGALYEARRLDAPEPGCFVLLRSYGGDGRHVGVMVDQFKMLHAHREYGAVIEVLSRSLWARRVLGYYRPEASA